MSAIVPTLARTATALSRSPLGLLFLCLFVGEAAILLFVSQVEVPPPELLLLLATAAAMLPLLVTGAIYRLISRHHTQIYAPADYREDRAFLEVLQLTTSVQPFAQTRAIAGDDFALFAPVPAANSEPRPEPGFYVLGDAAYYVTRKHRAFLLRRAGDPTGPREVKLVPAACRLVARQYCDRELHNLADVVEALETG
jgi:hypothetical protein